MLQFNGIGVLAVLATVMCWLLAAVLAGYRERSEAARRLSLLLVFEGLTLVTSGYLDLLVTPEVQAMPGYATWFRAEFALHTFGDSSLLALYPPFLAVALPSRATQIFSRPIVRRGLFVLAGVLYLSVNLLPMQIMSPVLYLCLTIMFGYAAVASILVWRHAPEGERARAGAFAIAFGLRDVLWGFVYGIAAWDTFRGALAEVPTEGSPLYLIYCAGTLLSVPLIAYGILRSKLFDLDLRIRWTIRQSTVAAAMVTIVYLSSEFANRFLSAEFGSYAGLAAAAAVIFFLTPLQAFAERVASAAMPNTNDTPEYAAFRKMHVYEAAIADAHGAEGVSAKERLLLERLRPSLGISEADATRIERDWVERRASVAG